MKNTLKYGLIIFSLLMVFGCGQNGDVRNRIAIVGSSTVFPFSSVVAETFAINSDNQVPKVEANGTGGGMKIFCSGTGLSGVDITNASRPMKKSEFDECQKNGVKEIIEVKIGYDGIVLAANKNSVDLSPSRKDIYLALAKQIPVNGQLVANPNKFWSDVNPALPKVKIDVMGPPPTSGTRDAFVELILEKGAEEVPLLKELKAKDEATFKAAATTIREDGAWKDMGENDNLIVQALSNSNEAIGVFGYSFYEENQDRLKAAKIDNQEPELQAIIDGKYPASRSLYFYAKKSNIELVPGIKEFMMEFTSPKAAGINGYLVSRGLIPLKPEELKQQAQNVNNLGIMAQPQK